MVATAENHVPVGAAVGGASKVLFVDDEPANLVVCDAACSDSFEVVTAESGAAALDVMRREEVAVIVADQRMPGMTGVELLEKVRKDFPDVSRLLITAYADMPATVDAINRGHVRRYIRKPWDPGDLKATIRDAFEVYEMGKKLRCLERRLTNTERIYALGVITASIGHELRNPISGVLAGVNAANMDLSELEAGGATADDVRKHVANLRDTLADVAESAQRVRDIVQGVELSTRMQTEAKIVDLGEVLRLALKLVSMEIRRTASLTLDVESSLRVLGTKTKLGQVVLNLLVNAVQAVSGGTPISQAIAVRLRRRDGWVFLEVSDSGPGVSDRDRHRIFDPFFTTKADAGTGMGLAISRAIAQELGGSLEVDRDADLGGALFRLRLPEAFGDPALDSLF
ncbi:MAG TPA: hybrid sensor histidine kinase/response regulator [Polyangiaceae bacterium]